MIQNVIAAIGGLIAGLILATIILLRPDPGPPPPRNVPNICSCDAQLEAINRRIDYLQTSFIRHRHAPLGSTGQTGVSVPPLGDSK